MVLRRKDNFGRERQLLRSTYSVCGSSKRGNRSVVSWTFVIFILISCSTKSWLPIGALKRMMPSVMILLRPMLHGSPCWPGSPGDQIVDFGLAGGRSVWPVERMRPLSISPSVRPQEKSRSPLPLLHCRTTANLSNHIFCES